MEDAEEGCESSRGLEALSFSVKEELNNPLRRKSFERLVVLK